jgi:hypothetical protein
MDLLIDAMRAPLLLLCCDADLKKIDLPVFEDFAEFVGKLRPFAQADLGPSLRQVLDIMPSMKDSLGAIMASASNTLSSVEQFMMEPKLKLIAEVMYADETFWLSNCKLPDAFIADADQVTAIRFTTFMSDSVLLVSLDLQPSLGALGPSPKVWHPTELVFVYSCMCACIDIMDVREPVPKKTKLADTAFHVQHK